jgi:hypothetical protein
MTWTATPLSNEKFTAAKLLALITELRPVSVRKASDGAAFPSTIALANDEDLLLSVTAGVTYDWDAMVYYQAGATADLKLAWTYPTSTMDYSAFGLTTATVFDEVVARGEASGTAHTFGGAGIASPRFVWFRGRIGVSSSGTLRLQRAQAVSTAENTQILSASWLRLQQAA